MEVSVQWSCLSAPECLLELCTTMAISYLPTIHPGIFYLNDCLEYSGTHTLLLCHAPCLHILILCFKFSDVYLDLLVLCFHLTWSDKCIGINAVGERNLYTIVKFTLLQHQAWALIIPHILSMVHQLMSSSTHLVALLAYSYALTQWIYISVYCPCLKWSMEISAASAHLWLYLIILTQDSTR